MTVSLSLSMDVIMAFKSGFKKHPLTITKCQLILSFLEITKNECDNIIFCGEIEMNHFW